MKFNSNILPFVAAFSLLGGCDAFAPFMGKTVVSTNRPKISSALSVSIGLGPDAEELKRLENEAAEDENIVEPDHELFRFSRLSDFDKECDCWYESLLGSDKPSFLGKVSEEAERRIRTLHKLERNVSFF